MGILAGSLGKCTRTEHEGIHTGHFAAFGAKVATVLSQLGIRHTAMTEEHIMWSTSHGGFMLLGWGNGERITWPDRAAEHVDDIRAFSESLGPEATAGLRFGYVYQLGPVGEWLFFEASDRSSGESAQPDQWQTQWEPPLEELSLGEDGLVVDVHREPTARSDTDEAQGLVAAKRLLMARLLRGVVSQDRGLEFSSLSELASLFAREKRPLRALALGTAATCWSDPDDRTANESLAELLDEVRRDTTEASQLNIERVVRDGRWSSLLELVWYLENVDIAEAIGRRRVT